jgi:MinD-like ATPase involved in chromosome partitioning or flagellar assembly
MTLVAVGSAHSCGVTTLASGLAMLWPRAGRRLLVEADPAGGVFGAAAGLAPEPGLVSLAAAARRSGEPALVFEHSQVLPDGTLLLAGPPGANRARSALAMLSGLFGRLGELDAGVVLDCGRLDPASPTVEFFEQADLGVLATRPRLADLHALAAFLEGEESLPERRVLVLVGSGPYGPGEVTEALGIEVAGQLPWDPEPAEAIPTSALGSRRLSRTPLVRALRTLADELATRVASRPMPDDPIDAAAPNSERHPIEVHR